jgi:hypothetical protein
MPPKKIGKMILATSTPKPVKDTPVVASKPKKKKKPRLKIVSSDCIQCPGLPFDPPPMVPPTPSVAGPASPVPAATPSLASTSIRVKQLPQQEVGTEPAAPTAKPTAKKRKKLKIVGDISTAVPEVVISDVILEPTSLPKTDLDVAPPITPVAPEVVISDVALEPTSLPKTDLDVAPPISPVAPETSPIPSVREIDVTPDMLDAPETSPIPSVREIDVTPDMLDAPDTPEERNELRNREDIEEHENGYGYLYPNLDDPQFNVKIAERKEFYDTRYDGKIHNVQEQADILCNAEFELAPHQLFVRNFLSFQTPYNSLLLYHGLGTGKTCSAISVSEEMRDYLKQMGITQRIIVVASPNVQDNFKLQLFDDRKLELVDGLWNIRACTGNKFLKEINPMSMRGLSKARVTSQINGIIRSSYLFLGYTEFANFISKKSAIGSDIKGPKRRAALIKAKLKKFFNNRLIIIDEVHNIRTTDDNKDKRVATELFKLVRNVDNLRLLFLSATPMYNTYKEVVWLVNIMNLNDNRPEIEVKDVFDSDGSFKTSETGEQIGKELLERKATGYISFIRGENPYTFPYRIWPDEFSKENTFEENVSPKFQLNGKPIIQNIDILSLYLAPVGTYQQLGYDYIIKRLKETGGDGNMPSFENMESLGYTLLQRPLESLNIVYPDERLTMSEDAVFDPKDIVGKVGLNRIMSYEENAYPPSRYDFEYISDEFGRIFSPSEIGKYSGKIKNISEQIMNSTGVVLVYSQYIDGGLVPVALALEELGFKRAGSVKSLFKDPPTPPIDALTFKSKEATSKKFETARYVMITGNKSLSPDNVADLKMATNVDNKNGAKVKVILISQAGSEGLDFKFIRQVHVLEPWYNMNRIEQIIGRAVRTCSHKDLPFSERNVEIFLYGTLLKNGEEEAADLYVYRLAELKALQIGHVSRVLKKVSVDCLLNLEQMGFTVEEVDQTVEQRLSNGKTIAYRVGDKPYTATCDYMDKCSYTCKPDKDINESDVSLDTYSEPFIMMNTDKITQKIKDLIKIRHFYRKKELLVLINSVKSYPLIQVNAALNHLVEDKNEYVSDKYGRIGNLVNIDDLYLFQPLELNNEHISVYDRSAPIEFKRTSMEFLLSDGSKKEALAPVSAPQREEGGKSIIESMQKNYDEATKKHDKVQGADSWYRYCSVVIPKMEKDGVSRDALLDFLVSHIAEELRFLDILTVLDYLDTHSESEFEKRLKKYFDDSIITNKGITGMLLQNTGKQQLVIKKEAWQVAEPEDYEDLSPQIKQIASRLVPAVAKLNNIIGFMANFKNDYIVYKVKLMTRNRHKGARCDQSNKRDAVQITNDILGRDEYSTTDKKMNHKQICVTQELTLRLYDKENKNGKRWFLTPAEAVLINVEKISFNKN